MASHRSRLAAGVALLFLACQPLAAARPQATDAEIAAATAAAEATDPTGKPQEAEDAWRKVIALQQSRARPDAAAMATAENRIGDSFYYRGKPDLAIAEYEKARDLLAAAGMGLSDAMSETLSNLGTMYTATGHPDRDVAIQRDALAMRVTLHGADDPRLALNYFNLGNALYENGDLTEAADRIERGVAMRLATMKPDNPELFLSLASAASIESSAGRLNRAVEFAQKAVALIGANFPPDHPYAGYVRGVLGKALLDAGRAAEAVDVNRQALGELAKTMGETHPLTRTTLNNLAVSLARLGRYDEARELTLASIAGYDKPMPAQVMGLVNASNFAAEAGHDDLAIESAEKGYAAAQATLPPEHEARGTIALTLAARLDRQGDAARARDLAKEALRIYDKTLDAGDPRRRDAAIWLGALEVEAGDRAAGYARLTDAADALEPAIGDVAESAMLGTGNSAYDSFARAAQAAVDMGRPADVFRYFQLAAFDLNAQASQQVALRNAAGHGTEAADHARTLQDAIGALRVLNVENAALLAAGKLDRARETAVRIEAEKSRVAALRATLAREVPGYDRYSHPEVVPLAALQARLAPGEGVLLALPARTRTTLMLVRRDRVAVASIATARAGLRPMVAAVRASIDAGLEARGGPMPAFDLAASHALYEQLFPQPIREAARGVTHLHVAATDALAALPFALLTADAPKGPGGAKALRTAHWLIRDMSIDVPVTLASIGNAPVRMAEPSFGGIGAPQLAGSPETGVKLAGLYRGTVADLKAIRELPALPGAARELDQMRSAFGAGKSLLLTGAEANEARVKAADLGSYSVLAFATHGLIAGELDGLREPALVLTPPAQASASDDGLLTASEIGALRLDADWVILSACNTAAGSTQSAPSYTGLAHAFLYAGARSLLLSHWQVRDDAATRLSVATVRGAAAGLDRAEALRRAMLALIADSKVPGGAHPAIWAPFILIGR